MKVCRIFAVAAGSLLLGAPVCYARATKPPEPIIVTASSTSMPAKYARGMHCASLLIQDYAGPGGRPDGVPEVWFGWKLPGQVAGSSRGSWNGQRIVPDRPIPRVAMLATRGASVKVNSQFDRRICAAADPRVNALTTSDSAAGVLPVYRDGYAGTRLQTPLNATTWGTITATIAKAHADKLAADAAAAQAALDFYAAQAAAAWQAKVDAWQVQCAPGSTARVQHGNVVEVWVCRRGSVNYGSAGGQSGNTSGGHSTSGPIMSSPTSPTPWKPRFG